jgi:benzoylformate decarboxylase
VNNGGYRIIKQRLLSFHQDDNFIGMDFADPPVDFAALAGSLGVKSVRVTDPAALRPALDAAFANGGTNLIEVITDGSL